MLGLYAKLCSKISYGKAVGEQTFKLIRGVCGHYCILLMYMDQHFLKFPYVRAR